MVGACVAGAALLFGVWLGIGDIRAHWLIAEVRAAVPEAELEARRIEAGQADAAVAANPWAWKAWRKRGNVFARARAFDQAVKDYDRSLELQPDHPPVLVEKGAALVAAGRLEEGEAAVREAIRWAPGWWGSRIQLAKILKGRGRNEEALAELRFAVQVRPDCAEAHFLAGLLLYEMERFREAREAFELAAAWGWDWRKRVPKVAADPRMGG